MGADWLFDGGVVRQELTRACRAAELALDRARSALEQADEDALTDRQRHALITAVDAVADARTRLRALDERLGEAQQLIEAVLSRARRPDLKLVQGI